ncbi:MAG TPA: inorganic phosphate transporter [Rhodospirillales bacterium]|nr:inorganic phosphate transporter [Rhodospirillales bacterium]
MDDSGPRKKTTLDKDLKRIGLLEAAVQETGQQIVKLGFGVVFLVAISIAAFIAFYDLSPRTNYSFYVVAACIIGGYMALNIGANDVANNVGPAVGSKALTLVGALAIAAIFEAAGAILAGGDVVSTIKKGIIDPALFPDTGTFIRAMLAALLAAALWLNLATYLGAPVSTTHAIVGGVMGAGITATGMAAVNWGTMSKIAASWVISPVLGGLIAAGFLAFIKFFIYYNDDMIVAARRWVPVLVSIMASVFAVYLVMKGLKKIWKPDAWMIAAIGAGAFVVGHALVKPVVVKASATLENRRKAVSTLFTIPLIFSAALLSFAHGANDVANAVGPLAAIVDAAATGGISKEVGVPLWVMLVGAFGIAAGLVLFGPKLIRTVGQQITKLDRARAFCVALSAAITVIIASALGLPVSSTHIAVGGVFGVGFLREYLSYRRRRLREEEVNNAIKTASPAKLEKRMEKARARKLVRRKHLTTIVAAWLVTVPLAALLAALLFFLFQLFA